MDLRINLPVMFMEFHSQLIVSIPVKFVVALSYASKYVQDHVHYTRPYRRLTSPFKYMD